MYFRCDLFSGAFNILQKEISRHQLPCCYPFIITFFFINGLVFVFRFFENVSVTKPISMNRRVSFLFD